MIYLVVKNNNNIFLLLSYMLNFIRELMSTTIETIKPLEPYCICSLGVVEYGHSSPLLV